jgi:hypothetical protein
VYYLDAGLRLPPVSGLITVARKQPHAAERMSRFDIQFDWLYSEIGEQRG